MAISTVNPGNIGSLPLGITTACFTRELWTRVRHHNRIRSKVVHKIEIKSSKSDNVYIQHGKCSYTRDVIIPIYLKL